jgi:hypothetical protein
MNDPSPIRRKVFAFALSPLVEIFSAFRGDAVKGDLNERTLKKTSRGLSPASFPVSTFVMTIAFFSRIARLQPLFSEVLQPNCYRIEI